MGGRYPANASRKPKPGDFPNPAPGPANDNFKPPKPANRNLPRKLGSVPKFRPNNALKQLLRQHPATRALRLLDGLWSAGLVVDRGNVPAGWVRTARHVSFVPQRAAGTGQFNTVLPEQTFSLNNYRFSWAAPGVNSVSLWQVGNFGSGRVGAWAETWARVITNAPPFPEFPIWPSEVPIALPTPVRPNPFPQIDPERTPIYEPVPTPRPIPYRALPRVRPNPRIRPQDRPGIVPGLPIYPNPGSRPLPDVVVTPRPRPDGITNPSLEITPSGMRATKPHLSRRPPKGTKERKYAISAGGVAMSIVGVVGEAVDVIDALHDALPEHLKARSVCGGGRYDVAGSYKFEGPKGSKGCKGPTPQAKLKALYKHIGQIDIGKAMGNLAYELVEDYAYGRMGQAFARDNRRAGRSAGLLLGPAL